MCDVPTRSIQCSTNTDVISLQHRWTVENFSNYPQETGEAQQSTPFTSGTFCTLKWSIHLYPNGVCEETEDFIGIYLYLVSCDRQNVAVSFKTSFFNSQGVEVCKMHTEGFQKISPKQRVGFNRILHRDTAFDESDLFLDDKLIIVSHITALADKVSNDSESESQDNLATDLGRLLKSQKFTDVILLTSNQKFLAHKAILAARSPYLRKLLEDEENKTPVNKKKMEVQISENLAVVMPEILAFIYTGTIEEFEKKVSLRLLQMSCHLGLGRLQTMCMDVLCKNLTSENVSDFFAIACDLSLSPLKEHAIKFIRANSTEVRKTKQWSELVRVRPFLINEIFPSSTNSPSYLNEF